MPTIKEILHFNYNGISSQDFGLMNISTNSGMYEEIFVSNRDIKETKVSGNDTPYFQGLDSSPREFSLELAFTKTYTDVDINEIIRWLFQENYKPLFFEGKPDYIFYCIAVSDSSIVHNGLKQGYITITMRCDSPYIYSPVMLTQKYDLSTSSTAFPIVIANKGHFDLYPEISIEKVGNGHITITNISNGGKIFEIRDLTDKEKIYVNSEKEKIETDIVGVYRYDKVIGDFLEFPYGKNTIHIVGKCYIQFRYQHKLRF